MGMACVKEVGSALCSIAGQLFVPTMELWRWRAQVKSRPVRRTAAKRLGLDLSEHAIRLLWSGVSGPDNSLSSAIQGSSRFWQSGLRARSNSHSVVARGELHQHSACGGQAREDEAILRCGVWSHAIHRFVHPDRPRLVGPRRIGFPFAERREKLDLRRSS
jgi:hypothetical protein